MDAERKRKNCFKEKSIHEQIKRIVAITIAVFLFLCILINVSIRQLVLNNAEQYTAITVIRLRNQIELMHSKMENYCTNLEREKSIQELMRCGYPQLASKIKDATSCLTKYKVLEPMIEDISLVNEIIHYSTVYDYEEMDQMRRDTEGNAFSWIGIRKHHFIGTEQRSDMLVYAGDIVEEEKNLGTVIISLNSEFLMEEGNLNTSYFLVSANGEIHPLNCSYGEARTIYENWKNSGEEIIRNNDFIVYSSFFEELNCYLIGALDVKKSGGGLSRIQILIWSCVILAVIFCVAFFVLISRDIVHPLYQLSETIQQIRTLQQRSIKKELDLKGCAEINKIGREFTGMLSDIEAMNHKIFQTASDLYEMKIQKQQAEFAWLRSQIDPHFLYNTLEVIRKMALDRHVPEIAQMTMDMGNIFRYGTKGSYIVPLEKELSIIQSYIRIQQLRFDGKIEAFYFVPEEIRHISVIKMLLQPIVENSIFHGLEPKCNKGNLYIGARIEEKKLIISIVDDGVGIPETQLKEIQRELEQESTDTGKHVGILNTDARIRLQYGKGYGLKVQSLEGDGTTVTMILPVC